MSDPTQHSQQSATRKSPWRLFRRSRREWFAILFALVLILSRTTIMEWIYGPEPEPRPGFGSAVPAGPRPEKTLLGVKPMSEVEGVYVGPDQKEWHVVQFDGEREEAIRSIRSEFHKATPQLVGVRPVLFEPGGRVWFAFQNELVGYDGEEWIKHDLGPKGYVEGACPNHGQSGGAGTNLLVGRYRLFLGNDAIHCFDGSEWTLQPFGHNQSESFLCPDPLTGGAFAWGSSGECIWRFLDGSWTSLTPPLGLGSSPVAAAPLDEGVLFLADTGGLYYKALGEEAPGFLRRLLSELGTGDSKQREWTMRKLAAAGGWALPYLRAARDTEEDPLLRHLLGTAVDRVRVSDDQINLFGPYVFGKSLLMHADAYGNVYLVAEDVQDGETQVERGLLVWEGGDRYRLLDDPAVTAEWSVGAFESRQPLVPRPGRVWLPARDGFDARLVDLESGEVVARISGEHRASPDAVKSDGTVFVGEYRLSPEHLANQKNTDRLPGKWAIPVLRSDAVIAVARDGTVWAEHAEQGMVRFRGEGWEVVEALRGMDRIQPLAIGRDGVFLGFSMGAYLFVEGGELHTAAELPELIAAHRGVIAQAFLGAEVGWVDPPQSGSSVISRMEQTPRSVQEFRYRADRTLMVERPALLVDGTGSIWLVHEGVLRVLVENKWLVLTDRLKALGYEGPPSHLWPLDQGRIYLPGHVDSKHPGGLVAMVEGELKLTQWLADVPKMMRQNSYAIDSEGGVWLPTTLRESGAQRRRMRHFAVSRVHAGRVVETVQDAWWPLLVDDQGDVWLQMAGGKMGVTLLSVWSSGHSLVTATVAHPGKYYRGVGTVEDSLLVPAAHGGAWLWTNHGLLELNVDEQAQPPVIVTGRYFALQGIKGYIAQVRHSALGYLVAKSGSGKQLYLLALPDLSEEGALP